MIIAENSKPSLSEFRELMKNVDRVLNISASSNFSYFSTRLGTALEEDVCAAALECAKNTKFEGSIQLVSGATFPDIIAAKHYGIEVKSSASNSWKTTGNSILERTRVEDIERIFLTFGKLSDPVSFISRPYEECLSGIAVTHSPRYQIDMQLAEGNTIFDKMGTTYEAIKAANDPITIVADYYTSQLKQGESLWWAGNKSDSAVPITVRLWNTLTAHEKDELEATIYVYFPETIMSKSPNKYDRATLWLVTQKSAVNANVRDSFSAGGKVYMKVGNGKYAYMPRVFKNIEEHIDLIVQILSSETSDVLSENWMECVFTNRVKQWIELVINYASDLSQRANAKFVLEQIFKDYGTNNI